MRLYIAGAWTEQHKRARPMIARARAVGIEISHDWTVPEMESVEFNDSQLSAENRRRHAIEDMQGVLAADVLWLLVPESEGSRGAWVELGAALAAQWLRLGLHVGWPLVVVSGRQGDRCIFIELADQRFESDEPAFAWIAAEHVARGKEVHILQHAFQEEAAGDVGQG